MNNMQFGGIFCDDVRHENNGKLLIIGAYGDQLLFEKLPATLKEIEAMFYLEFDIGADISSACFKLLLDDEPLVEVDGKVEKNENFIPRVTNRESIRGILSARNIAFASESVLKIVATINDSIELEGPCMLVSSKEIIEAAASGDY